MTASLALTGRERVLEVGTGSGYQAAILSKLAREVHSVELLPALAYRAARTLSRLRCGNVAVHVGDGSEGWLEAAPYAAIVVTAASPGVPGPLVNQLDNHGRLVLPVARSNGYQLLTLICKDGGSLTEQVLASVAFVPLRGKFGITRDR
jgi:protein-L-isoaspartate(D-aspartate) O-methyltransferase